MPFLVEVSTNLREHGPIIRSAVVATSQAIRDRMRKDITGSIRNGRRFARGLQTGFKAVSGGYVINVYLRPAYAKVFEYGGVSVGKPTLWIPVPPLRAKVRNYGGKLIRPKGKRVLIRPKDGKVMYAGVRSVTNKPRFHLRQIAYQEAENFLVHMREGEYGGKTTTTIKL